MNNDPSNSFSRKLSFLFWAIVAWLALAGTSYGLGQSLEHEAAWWVLILGSAAFLLPATMRAAYASRSIARFFRVIFWIGELLGILVLSIVLGEEWPSIHRAPSSAQFLGIGLALILLGGIWTGIRIFRQARLRPSGDQKGGRFWWLADCGYGALTIVVVTAGSWSFTEYFYIPRTVRASQQKWAEIGLSMDALEKECKKVEENESFHELVRDLAPFGIKTFYKPKAEETSPNAFDMPNDVVLFIGQAHGDQVIFPTPTSGNGRESAEETARKFAEQMDEVKNYLSSHANDFDRLYQGVLSREVPVWAFDPNDLLGNVPDFLLVRKLSQLITVDACFKLQRGDTKGAAVAYAAADRMFKNLNENPYFVSFMIRIAIEGLWDANIAVRLPEEPETLKTAAADVNFKREQFQRHLQFEGRYLFHQAQSPVTDWKINDQAVIRGRIWISRLVERIVKPVFLQLDAAKAAGVLAQELKVYGKARDLEDVGEGEIDRINHANLTIAGPNFLRAYMRTNFVMLLHEETAVLRAARTQVAAGKLGAQGEWPSTVVPLSKWVVTSNESDHSVTLRLTPMPEWVTKREVVDDAFFPVLPDGGNTWKFSTL